MTKAYAKQGRGLTDAIQSIPHNQIYGVPFGALVLVFDTYYLGTNQVPGAESKTKAYHPPTPFFPAEEAFTCR
jgi:hypothetical protein